MSCSWAVFLKILQGLSYVATIAMAGLIYLAWEQVKLLKEQARTDFENGLTKRYRSIMENIPTDIWLGSRLESLDKERRDRCRDAIYRYIDICQEQTFLYSQNSINDETWIQWSDGIKTNMTKIPAFTQVWAEVEKGRPESFKELRELLLPQDQNLWNPSVKRNLGSKIPLHMHFVGKVLQAKRPRYQFPVS